MSCGEWPYGGGGGWRLAQYRLLRLKDYRRSIDSLEFECESDESALATAMDIAGHNAIELWRGDQKLAFIAAGIFSITGAAAGTDIPICRPYEKE